MKTAIYVEDGTVQLVITPETKFEKNSLEMFRDKPLEAQLFSGSFYDCRGGWVRQSAYNDQGWGGVRSDDNSIILRVRDSESMRNKLGTDGGA